MLQKLFGFDHKQNKVRTEVIAGVTTFLTMAYILAVNPSIFSVLAIIFVLRYWQKSIEHQLVGGIFAILIIITICICLGYRIYKGRKKIEN